MARFHRATSLLGLFLLALFVQTPSSADAARTLKGSVGKRDKGAIEINQARRRSDPTAPRASPPSLTPSLA
jgi:hypothetical protein